MQVFNLLFVKGTLLKQLRLISPKFIPDFLF